MSDFTGRPEVRIPEDYKSLLAKREETIREQWVKLMQARLVRAELDKCYKKEGVNHYEACYDLTQKYKELAKDGKVTGFRKLDFST